MKKSQLTAMLLIVLILAASSLAASTFMQRILIAPHYTMFDSYVYHFRVTNPGGTPVTDGAYPATFSLYDDSTSGTLLWAETLSVEANDGLVIAPLGKVHPITRDMLLTTISSLDTRRYLETVFNGETVTPRIVWSSVPFSNISERVLGDIQTDDDFLRVGDDTSPLQTYCDMSTDGGGWTMVRAGTDSTTRVDSGGINIYGKTFRSFDPLLPIQKYAEIKKGDMILYGGYAGSEIKITGQDFKILSEDELQTHLKLDTGGMTIGAPPALSFNGTNYLVVWDGSDTAIHATPNGIALGANAANGLALGAPVAAAPNAQLVLNALALRRGPAVAARLLVAGGDRGELELADLTESVSLKFTTTEVEYSKADKKVKLDWQNDKIFYKVDGSDTAGISSTGGHLGLFVAPGKTLSVPATGGSVDIAAPATLASLACPDMDLDGTLDLVSVSVTSSASDFFLDGTSTFDCAGTATFDNPVHIGGGAPPPPGSFLHVNGNITATGAKLFVQEHPQDPNQYIAFVALEGPEAGTYTRGSFQLENGLAEIQLPESFSLVTGEQGLTVQVTPRGKVSGMLYVESVTPSKLLVMASDASDASVKFDYLVNGVRIGYENFESLRNSNESNPNISPKLSVK